MSVRSLLRWAMGVSTRSPDGWRVDAHGGGRGEPPELGLWVAEGPGPQPHGGLEPLRPDDDLLGDVFLEVSMRRQLEIPDQLLTSLLILYLSEDETSGMANFRNINKRDRVFSNTTTNISLEHVSWMKWFSDDKSHLASQMCQNVALWS